MNTDADVVVVGAGLAGLRAADLLRAQGRRVVLLEARDRVGGRTWTTSLAGAPVELGAQWVGPAQPRMLALLDELGLSTFDTAWQGKKVVVSGGRVRRYSGTIPPLSPVALAGLQAALWAIDRLARQVDLAQPWSGERAQRLDQQTLEQWKRRHLPRGAARQVFDTAIRVVFGAEPAELSLLWAAHYVAAAEGLNSLIEVRGGAQERRISGGTQQAAERLAARLDDLRLDCPVTEVHQDPRGVTVKGRWGEVRALRAVIALPPHLCARIAFTPPLPAARDALTQRFGMGQTIKAQVRYGSAFWRERGETGEAVMTHGPVSVVLDGSGPAGQDAALTVFSVAGAGRGLAGLDAPARRRAVLDALVTCFGAQAAEPLDYVDVDWSAQEWSRGCPTASPGPGVLAGLGGAQRDPVGRLHWAGTETARRWTGYMEGALESAERVTAEIERAG